MANFQKTLQIKWPMGKNHPVFNLLKGMDDIWFAKFYKLDK